MHFGDPAVDPWKGSRTRAYGNRCSIYEHDARREYDVVGSPLVRSSHGGYQNKKLTIETRSYCFAMDVDSDLAATSHVSYICLAMIQYIKY